MDTSVSNNDAKGSQKAKNSVSELYLTSRPVLLILFFIMFFYSIATSTIVEHSIVGHNVDNAINIDSPQLATADTATDIVVPNSNSIRKNIMTIPDYSKRLCEENFYKSSLSHPLSYFASQMDAWLQNKQKKEVNLVKKTGDLAYNHDRFDAFEVMGSCKQNCIGGKCGDDESKIACGVNNDTFSITNGASSTAVNYITDSKPTCIVYSIGSNNQWLFEEDILKTTPCEVHTFDCTWSKDRFQPPNNPRLHFHHVCLGTENRPSSARNGEFWTLDKMTTILGHDKIDLLKMDIEGYEWGIFHSWPEHDHIQYNDVVLPMQVLVEIHYQTHFPEIVARRKTDFKYSTDMIRLQESFLKMGYAVVVRDDNAVCAHCTELTLVRIRCPPVPV